MRVAAGAIARKILGEAITIRAALVQIGPHAVDRGRWNWDEDLGQSLLKRIWAMVDVWEAHPGENPQGRVLHRRHRRGRSGGRAGRGGGMLLYGKLDAEPRRRPDVDQRRQGGGDRGWFRRRGLTGEENADEMRAGNDGPIFLSNQAGGILGGISSGQPVVARCAFCLPPPATPRRSVNEAGEVIEVTPVKGRHDPCVGIRAAPVVEADDRLRPGRRLRHRAQMG